MTKEQIEKIAEELEWNVTWDEKEKCVNFQKYSTFGQDFSFDIWYENLDEIPDKVYDYWASFDASEAAFLWLDETGHGKNGAPYEMGDVYKDMCECEERMEELALALVKGD